MHSSTLIVVLLCLSPALVDSCTTLVAGRLATADGSVMSAHSNDGDGGTAGNLRAIPAANHSLPAARPVSGGSVAQVASTHAYFTKVGGYASINEHQVGLAESTCVAAAPFAGNRSAGAALNIVALPSAPLIEEMRSKMPFAVAILTHSLFLLLLSLVK